MRASALRADDPVFRDLYTRAADALEVAAELQRTAAARLDRTSAQADRFVRAHRAFDRASNLR